MLLSAARNPVTSRHRGGNEEPFTVKGDLKGKDEYSHQLGGVCIHEPSFWEKEARLVCTSVPSTPLRGAGARVCLGNM